MSRASFFDSQRAVSNKPTGMLCPDEPVGATCNPGFRLLDGDIMSFTGRWAGTVGHLGTWVYEAPF